MKPGQRLRRGGEVAAVNAAEESKGGPGRIRWIAQPPASVGSGGKPALTAFRAWRNIAGMMSRCGAPAGASAHPPEILR
jgi:hypothetical protein